MGGRRGRLIAEQDKVTAINLIEEACAAGARLKPACEILEIDVRTFQRWNKLSDLQDKRRGPITAPANKLTPAERQQLLTVVNLAQYRNQSPCQIVPNLADKQQYIGSESTIYRILHTEKMMKHRSAARPRKHQKPAELKAIAPNSLWSWDITYLLSHIRGQYFYLYLFLDVFSRKIVAAQVYDEQLQEYASQIVSMAYQAEGVSLGQVRLHSDNGGPMKGSLMLATLEKLGVAVSFSRPSVSDDNPFSEAVFRTVKYCPEYPNKPFACLADAQTWVDGFVHWYNNIHLHSGIKFVTPHSRHEGNDRKILNKRKQVYELAKEKNPNRWSRQTRNWSRIEEVFLNRKRTG